MKRLDLENGCKMTQPSNEKITEALERFSEPAVQPSPPPSSQPQEQLPAELPPSEVEEPATPDADPSELIDPDEPTEEPDEILMSPPSDDQTTQTPAGQFIPPIRQNRPPLYQTMKFRQTIIPVLLTCSLLTLLASSLKFAAGPDSIFSDLPLWLPITLAVAGAVLLMLAVLNMLAVKHAAR
jgi:hypothetical protein